MSQDEDPPPPPIPQELYSEYEERPFGHCTRCGESLNDDEGGFQISKAYKRGECVMEYALCDHCRTAMLEEFSQESKKRLSQFQDDHVQLDRGLDCCSVCGVSRTSGEINDFVITGLCEGSNLMHGIMVCGKCGDGIQDVISAKTRDTWRRFVDENFPGPPGEGEYPEIESSPTQPLTAMGGSWKL
ncbi:MAG TPA: hypothetical protein VD994_01960 [Prosthecobacter sp.]|nr:hypothetical protein [Prosthecobacter sp.]